MAEPRLLKAPPKARVPPARLFEPPSPTRQQQHQSPSARSAAAGESDFDFDAAVREEMERMERSFKKEIESKQQQQPAAALLNTQDYPHIDSYVNKKNLESGPKLLSPPQQHPPLSQSLTQRHQIQVCRNNIYTYLYINIY